MLHSVSGQLKQTANDIWSFLRSPQDLPATENTTSDKLKILLRVLCLYVAIGIVLTGLLSVISELGLYNSDNHAIADMMRTMPIWSVLLLGIIVLPFIEELVFRYGLRFSKGYIASLLVLVLLVGGVYAFKLLPLVGALTVIGGLGVVWVFYMLKADVIVDKLRQVWPRMYGIVFYTIAVVFGLIHIANYTDFDYTSLAILLVPVLVAPQIIGGLLIGYMRVKHGFYWGFYLHAAHNAFFFIIGLLFMSALEEKLNISNTDYAIKVEEHLQIAPTTGTKSYLQQDSVVFLNQKLNDIIVALLEDDNKTIDFDRSKYKHTYINLSFKNRTADANILQSRKLILAQLQELYKFDVRYQTHKVDAWDLEVADNSLLTAHTVDDTGSSTIHRDSEAITLENVTTEELLKTIGTDFKVHLLANRKSGTSANYNFELPKKNFEQVKEELKSRYGIVLQSKEELAEMAIVEFR